MLPILARLGKTAKKAKDVAGSTGKSAKDGFLKRIAKTGGSGAIFGAAADFMMGGDDVSGNSGGSGSGGAGSGGAAAGPGYVPVTGLPAVGKVSVDEEKIIPKEGPNEGLYAEHLNLIIQRVASLESSVDTQNKIIAKLTEAVKKKTEDDRKENLRRKRKEDEDDVENKNAFSYLKDAKQAYHDTKDKAESLFAKIAKAVGYAITGSVAGLVMGFGDEIATFVEYAIPVMDTTFEAATRGIAASAGMAAGASTKVAQSAQFMNKMGAVAQGTVKVATPSAVPALTSAVSTGTKVATTVQAALPAAGNTLATANKWRAGLMKMKGIFDAIAKASDSMAAKINALAAKLPASVVEKISSGAKSVLKWYLIAEAITFMLKVLDRFTLGLMSVAEFHESNKAQLNRLARGLGAPYLMTFILTVAGSVFPVLGNIAGGLAGLLIGIILGPAVYDLLGIEHIINAFYDFGMGDRDAFGKLADRAIDAAKQFFIDLVTPDVLIDRVATVPEIKAEYGEDATLSEIAVQATQGIGTDENALYYVAENITTYAQYKSVDDEMIRTAGAGLIATAKSELSEGEYKEFADLLTNNMQDADKFREAAKEAKEAVKSTKYGREIEGLKPTKNVRAIDGRPTDRQRREEQTFTKKVGGVDVEVNGETRTDFSEKELQKINAARSAAAAMGNPDPFPQAEGATPKTEGKRGREIEGLTPTKDVSKIEGPTPTKRGREIEGLKPTKDVRAIDGQKPGRQINQVDQSLRKLQIKAQEAKQAYTSWVNSEERGTFKMVMDDMGFDEEKVYDDADEDAKHKELRSAKASTNIDFSRALPSDTIEKVEFLQDRNLLPRNFEGNVNGYLLTEEIKKYLSGIEARAEGGPVEEGQVYLTGEQGVEAFRPEGYADKILAIKRAYSADHNAIKTQRKESLRARAAAGEDRGRIQFDAERIIAGNWTGSGAGPEMIQFGGPDEWATFSEIGEGKQIPGMPSGWIIKNGYPGKGDLSLNGDEGNYYQKISPKGRVAVDNISATQIRGNREQRLRIREYGNADSFKGTTGQKMFGGGLTTVMQTRAKGGPVEDGSDYLVGEEGPELMVPAQDGVIIPADTTKTLLDGRREFGGFIKNAGKYLVGEAGRELAIPGVGNARQVMREAESVANAIKNPSVGAAERILRKVAGPGQAGNISKMRDVARVIENPTLGNIETSVRRNLPSGETGNKIRTAMSQAGRIQQAVKNPTISNIKAATTKIIPMMLPFNPRTKRTGSPAARGGETPGSTGQNERGFAGSARPSYKAKDKFFSTGST